MCGIVGLVGAPESAREAFLALTTLQHRGQDAAGILTYDADGFHRVKNMGLVDSVFDRENMKALSGQMALGHARYGTVGRGDVTEVQPFLLSYPYGIGFIHNGNLVNVEDLRAKLRRQSRRHILTHSDTEILMNLFADGLAQAQAEAESNTVAPLEEATSLSESPLQEEGHLDLPFDQICQAARRVFTEAQGSYCVVALIADYGMVAFRDPHGLRPLVLGRRKKKESDKFLAPNGMAGEWDYIVASESVALPFLGYEPVRDVAPGEVIAIDQKGNLHSRVLGSKPHRPCMFEWVYFASPESELDGSPVYGTRIELGRSLAQTLKEEIGSKGWEADIVVPVPETSRIAAISLAEELGIPYREVLIKNRYIKRTFILDSQDKRQSAVNLKLSPVRSEIEGKRVILVDDSIVRGTTSRKIIDLVRKAGASQVFFVSTCPPIRYPCYYGIDFPSSEELVASERSLEEIRKELGADALVYQNEAGLAESIRKSAKASRALSFESPCMACLDGKYPTDVTAGKRFSAARSAQRQRSSRR